MIVMEELRVLQGLLRVVVCVETDMLSVSRTMIVLKLTVTQVNGKIDSTCIWRAMNL
jgi:hypothetical protein